VLRGGGKRLRPIILLEICRAATIRGLGAGGSGPGAAAAVVIVDPADAALFIEYLHTASLIIDDLPAFDNDDERRGKPALHVKTNQAVAQMTALSLVAASFKNISHQLDWIRTRYPCFKGVDRIGTRLCYEVGQAMGAQGAAGGQAMDINATTKTAEPGTALEIARRKTASFFEVAFVTGWLVAGSPPGDARKIQEAGRHFGIAYQLADDLGDMERDAARHTAGKPGWNYANFCGVERAGFLVAQNLSACRRILRSMGVFTPLWEEIFEKVWGMATAGAAASEGGAAQQPARAAGEAGEGAPSH
jgi:geranylgeranyl diphosphate synthase type II